MKSRGAKPPRQVPFIYDFDLLKKPYITEFYGVLRRLSFMMLTYAPGFGIIGIEGEQTRQNRGITGK